MPTKREREYYAMGFRDGLQESTQRFPFDPFPSDREGQARRLLRGGPLEGSTFQGATSQRRSTAPKRKLSAWNKFVKANAKKPRFRLRSGAPNLKKLGVAFRKTPAGRKKRR